MDLSSPVDRARLLARLIDHAAAAGDVVWRHFQCGCAVERKSDASPVTVADREAEAVILAGLAADAGEVPVIAEEEAAAGRVPAVGDAFFLVDPLDGTKEFVRRGTDFTVNIGLIEHKRPTMGVVYAPARGQLWWGDVAAGSAWQAPRAVGEATHGRARAIAVRVPAEPPVAVASRSHGTPATERWLAAAGVGERVAVGSSLKFVLVASGEADVYPRPGPTMEWDTAAGDAVLRAAGGRTLDIDGAPLGYGKERFFNPGFTATGAYRPAALRPYMEA